MWAVPFRRIGRPTSHGAARQERTIIVVDIRDIHQRWRQNAEDRPAHARTRIQATPTDPHKPHCRTLHGPTAVALKAVAREPVLVTSTPTPGLCRKARPCAKADITHRMVLACKCAGRQVTSHMQQLPSGSRGSRTPGSCTGGAYDFPRAFSSGHDLVDRCGEMGPLSKTS